MPKRNRWKHQKNTSPKSIWTSILTSENLPKSLQNRPGTRKNRVSNEARFATLWKSHANRRKATGLSVCKASKRLRIWFGLLDFPLVVQIIVLCLCERKLESTAGVSCSVACQLLALTTQVNLGLFKFFWERIVASVRAQMSIHLSCVTELND